MRVHVDFTLEVFDKMITSLGSNFRRFKDEVCSKYDTCELPKEAAACAAQEAQSEARGKSTPKKKKKKKKSGQKALNVNTYKHHAMRDYVSYIHQYGTIEQSQSAGQLHGNILVNCFMCSMFFEDEQPMLDDSYVGIFWIIPPYADCPSRMDSLCWTTVTWEYSGQFLQTQSVLRGQTAHAGRQFHGNILVNCSTCRMSFEDGQRMLEDSYVGIFWVIAPNAACPSRTDSLCWTTVTWEYSGQLLQRQSVL
jgi:hypothetical protein